MKRKLICVLAALCLLAGMQGLPARAEEPVFDCAEDLLEYIWTGCAPALAGEISFGYTEALDGLFSEPEPMEAVLYSCGLMNWRQYQDAERRTVRLTEIEYYPGYRIARLREAQEEHLLDEEEKAALAQAEQIVSEVAQTARNEYETALGLHDALICRVTYDFNDTIGQDSRDTAVGALVNGRAECDGYADAYYLLCSLAGIPAGYQHGSSLGEEGWIGHMWNVIRWDGLWYQTDVTWDDLNWDSYPQMGSYRYFSVSADMMGENHVWDPALSPFEQAETMNRDVFFYTRANDESEAGVCFDTVKEAAEYIVRERNRRGAGDFHVMVRADSEDGTDLNSALGSCGLRGGWRIFSHRMGDDLCIDVLVAD